MHDHRQVDTLLPQPQGELADAADLTELAECQRQRLANPQIRVLFQAVVGTAAVADRDRRVELAARCLQAQRLLGRGPASDGRDRRRLVDNFRPSVPARLGIDYPRLKAINPRLVYCGVVVAVG